jgi:hypothetical protein
VPLLLDALVQGGQLMQIERAYRLRTRESQSWESTAPPPWRQVK